MSIFSYSYMNRALIIGFLLGILIPMMGLVVVNKKISVIGDALSHVSLSGVLLGLLFGFSETLGAIVMCIVAAILLEFIRKKFPSYGEISVAIVMSFGIGFASMLSGFVTKAANFESFLFGSIIAAPDSEFYLISIAALLIFILFIIYYKDLCHISFDETSARLSGINVDRVNLIFMILIAVTISISAKTVGVLIVSSLLVVPVSCAMAFELGYFKTLVLSSLFGLVFTVAGLVASFYLGLKPGGTIVMIGLVTLMAILILKKKN
ncbi:metal ABC transporter permease [Peptoniphilus catoniae]|uniref:metal ABC transporter permease n=1 Tax=Peptoniphilus catoniae TaxID=1660341 RepID=UPI0010FE7CE1|nr:metal ABC transporter permease [Peptoniphilus catoniae]